MADQSDPSRTRFRDSSDLSGLRVLVVEDNRDNRLILALLLEAYGAHVRAEAGVADALVAYEAFHPDVIVTDIDLGDATGFELVEELRLRGERTPAVAISAVGDPAEALARGCHAFLSKPVASRELAETVRAVTADRPAP